MAGRVVFGGLINGYFHPPSMLNLWGQFRFCSFKATQEAHHQFLRVVKTESSSGFNKSLAGKNISLENATAEEIASNPDLLQQLAQQYQKTRSDPEFKEGIEFCTKVREQRLKN